MNESIRKRRSIRRYTDQPVSEEQLKILLEAAMATPSACDCRPWEFVVVREREQLAKLAKVHRYAAMAEHCAVAIVLCAVPARGENCPGFWPQDCGAVAQTIWLQATELGLGMVWCGIHPTEQSERRTADVIGAPDDIVPFALLCIGHPAEHPEPRDRFEPDRIHWEQW